MASAEFQGNVLLRGSLINWFLALVVVYAGLSAIAWLIGRRVRSKRANLWFYVLGGLFGMLVIEWWLIGFYPGSGKKGIQAAMFTNWAAVFTLPRLFTAQPAEETQRVRSKVRWTILIYSFAAPLLVLVLPIPPGGTVGILMSAYSILLSFLFVPFLVKSEPARNSLYGFNLFLALAAIINVFLW